MFQADRTGFVRPQSFLSEMQETSDDIAVDRQLFAGVFCHNSSDPDATVMLIAAVVVGFCETLTLLSLYGTILLEAENEKKLQENSKRQIISGRKMRVLAKYTQPLWSSVCFCLMHGLFSFHKNST